MATHSSNNKYVACRGADPELEYSYNCSRRYRILAKYGNTDPGHVPCDANVCSAPWVRPSHVVGMHATKNSKYRNLWGPFVRGNFTPQKY